MRYLTVLLLIHLTFPLFAVANVPPPQDEPDKVEKFELVVQRIRPSQAAVIKIPATAVRGQRGFGAATDSSGPGTIIAGIAIALGVVAGGLWLLQRSRRLPMTAKTSIATAVVAVIGLSVIPLAMADLLPPPNRPRPSKAVKTEVQIDRRSSKVVLRLTETQWKTLNAQFNADGGDTTDGAVGSAPPRKK